MCRLAELSSLRTQGLQPLRLGFDALRSRIHPDSYERKIDETANNILYDLLQDEYEAFDERDIELFSRRHNTERQRLLYYPSVRNYTEKQDSLFRQLLPFEYNKALQAFGSQEKRWSHAAKLAQSIQDQLHIGSPEQGGVVDCRAKSLFSLWLKMKSGNLDPDEIFDSIGIRITCKDKESARNMHLSLLAQNKLMAPQLFRHRNGEKHQSSSDNLDSPKENGFASIRMNFVDGQFGIYEIQIQTMEDYLKWRQHEKRILAHLAASPKYGPLVDPE